MLYENDTATLGLWLSRIPIEHARELVHYIFRTHKDIQQINFRVCFTDIIMCRKELPSSIEEFNQRLTRKFKYNMKREKKLLEAEAGPLTVEEYSAENFPDDLFTSYFRLKAGTHKRNYNMTSRQYIDKFHVSDAYVIRGGNSEIISLVLSCEQCPAAYIENLTYDMKYSKYSPGKMIYHYFLEALIRKGVKELYLGGGKGKNYEYKRHYGSIEDFVYSGVIHRHFHRRLLYRLKLMTKKIIPAGFIRYIKHFLK